MEKSTCLLRNLCWAQGWTNSAEVSLACSGPRPRGPSRLKKRASLISRELVAPVCVDQQVRNAPHGQSHGAGAFGEGDPGRPADGAPPLGLRARCGLRPGPGFRRAVYLSIAFLWALLSMPRSRVRSAFKQAGYRVLAHLCWAGVQTDLLVLLAGWLVRG
jgi:hypothetical protein